MKVSRQPCPECGDVVEILLICECETCGDFEEVKRRRTVCPIGPHSGPWALDGTCVLYHHHRIKCVACDYADDLGSRD